uniref:Exonuclease domain-containing protein n=1 Tax=Romanomermis culicivorax TaxID=13658 RepID=A0A915L475_ROMCU
MDLILKKPNETGATCPPTWLRSARRLSLKIKLGPSLIINQPRSVLDAMDDWCKEQHARSGLVRSVLDSNIKLEEAENLVLDFVRTHTNPRVCPLAGNSVHVDRSFILKYMPRLAAHLHYRIVDVSSIKEICRSWYPSEYKNAPKKKITHRAMDDIRESLVELNYYRKSIFK